MSRILRACQEIDASKEDAVEQIAALSAVLVTTLTASAKKPFNEALILEQAKKVIDFTEQLILGTDNDRIERRTSATATGNSGSCRTEFDTDTVGGQNRPTGPSSEAPDGPAQISDSFNASRGYRDSQAQYAPGYGPS